VETGRVLRQDLVSQVTASGEIKPRNYINIGANAQGQITDLLVREGDRVRKGQLLARLESVQPEASVSQARAEAASAEAESAAAEAGVNAADHNLRTLEAAIARARAEVHRAELDYKRAEQLYLEKLVARQQYEQQRAVWEAQAATLRESESRLVQARSQREQAAAQLSAAQKRITQSRAGLARVADVLRKHSSYAPIDGIVTNLPVRVGEIVVPGIQNSPASTIMTIADMSLITAEVKVDETDIVNVKLNQSADVTVDAMPNRTFKGTVIEIGNSAILRSTGVAASQSMISSQEAKDFKVVIALHDPPEELRPGLSATAKITTATRQNVLAIPIQSLTVRQKGDLEATDNKKQNDGVLDPVLLKARKEEMQGVFLVQGKEAVFRKIETGITGATEIEILSGLDGGEEIITGSYQVIRTIKNRAQIKVDNKKEKRG